MIEYDKTIRAASRRLSGRTIRTTIEQVVKRRRLELPRHNRHYPLKVARLPIPPPLHIWLHCPLKQCPEQDSNLHVSQHSHLKRARLPFRHLGRLCRTSEVFLQQMSGKRDSNSRPRPWQGRALPTELLPHCCVVPRCHRTCAIPNCGCKGTAFSGTDKGFSRFFSKKLSLGVILALLMANPCDLGSPRR